MSCRCMPAMPALSAEVTWSQPVPTWALQALKALLACTRPGRHTTQCLTPFVLLQQVSASTALPRGSWCGTPTRTGAACLLLWCTLMSAFSRHPMGCSWARTWGATERLRPEGVLTARSFVLLLRPKQRRAQSPYHKAGCMPQLCLQAAIAYDATRPYLLRRPVCVNADQATLTGRCQLLAASAHVALTDTIVRHCQKHNAPDWSQHMPAGCCAT